MTDQIFSFWTSLKVFTESCASFCIFRFLLSRFPAQVSLFTGPHSSVLCSQRRNKEQPCARARNKQAEEDPCQASALPPNLANGKPSVSSLLKRAGGPGQKKNNQPTNQPTITKKTPQTKKKPKASHQVLQTEAGCVPFPAHTAGCQHLEKMSLLSPQARSGVGTAAGKAAVQRECLSSILSNELYSSSTTMQRAWEKGFGNIWGALQLCSSNTFKTRAQVSSPFSR